MVHMSPPVQGVLDPRYYISASAGRSCGQDYLAAMQACPFPATVLPTAADWLNVSGPAITPDLLQVPAWLLAGFQLAGGLQVACA